MSKFVSNGVVDVEAVLEFAQKVINCMSRELVNRKSIPATDLEDISQEMLLGVIEKLPEYDHGKYCIEAFVTRVILDIKAEISRKYECNKGFSLKSHVDYMDAVEETSDGEKITIEQTMDEEHYCPNRINHTLSKQQELELRIDTQNAIKTLPLQLRNIVNLISDGKKITAIIQKIGVNKKYFYSEILPEIQAQMKSLNY